MVLCVCDRSQRDRWLQRDGALEMPTGKIREEVQALGREEGLIPAKLEGTDLVACVKPPSSWSVSDTAIALCRLFDEIVSIITDEKERSAARATLNLVLSPVRGRSANARQEALAQLRGVHKDTVRSWWRAAATTLSASLDRKITELNRNPSNWEAYLATSSLIDEDRELLPDYSLQRVEVLWCLKGRTVSEFHTTRTLVAHRDGIDSYSAKTWYFSDPDPAKYEVVPLINCLKGEETSPGRGILLTNIKFPPLMKGEAVSFGYKVLIHSSRDTEAILQHEVRSAGTRLLRFQVQFDPEVPAERVWRFVSLDDTTSLVPPDEGSTRYLTGTQLGYFEQLFRDCRHGYKYGIAWKW